VAFDADGSVLIGTGPHGKLFRVQGDQVRPALLTRAEAQQVTAFARDQKNRLILATANPGKLFRLSGEHAEQGTYESEVKDAARLRRGHDQLARLDTAEQPRRSVHALGQQRHARRHVERVGRSGGDANGCRLRVRRRDTCNGRPC
jgi:hypothetical protein